MKHEYLTNVPLDEARSEYLRAVLDSGAELMSETVRAVDALNRVTSRAVYARLSSPHYNASAMDGAALEARRTFGATETTPKRLSRGEYFPIDTGDPLPADCDAVVMAEDIVDDGDGILLFSPASPWQHIRQVGEDICEGDMILPSFTRVTPAAIGALLAGGALELEVLRRPRVAILPTGDELTEPCEAPKEGAIPEFNSAIFSAMLREWDAEPFPLPIVRDDRAKILEAVKGLAASFDAILIIAGTSAGRDDNTASVIAECGRVIFHGIAIKPGKPAVLGLIGKTPVMGVPGYPVSGITVLEELFKPVLFSLMKRPLPERETERVRASRRVNSSLKYRELVRAALTLTDGGLAATPLNRGAGVVTSFVKADCVLDIPQNSEGLEAGEAVCARLMRPRAELIHRVSVVGSHDPLIDELADILRRSRYDISVASAHVGSMGAITALIRGEADMGGIHLLDEASGRYNEAYIDRFFPNGGVTLVECVYRIQGLMVQSGNPKRISGFADTARAGLRYVNRQRGSGTRVLADHMAKELNIDTGRITGYDREETTHTAVAAQIAAGTADAGLGILSAARMYGLEFIPVCREQYDLIVLNAAMERDECAALLETLRGSEFRERLERLGGYELERPGEVRRIWKG